MSTQYDILKYLQENGEEDISTLIKIFGVATSKKLRFLRNAGMIEYRFNTIVLAKNVTEEQIMSKKPYLI